MNTDCIFEKISINDLNRIIDLAKNNNGNADLTPTNFEHWYFKNPTQSFSLWKVIVDNKLEGYATTNNFNYFINNQFFKVALPQNVLTSYDVRGKGFFGKLYLQTEKENITENKVDCFMTFTGDMSTPIFLNKFNYIRGKCPDIKIYFNNPFWIISKKNYKLINLEDVKDFSNCSLPNSRIKNYDYFKWRYSNCNKQNLKIISVQENDIAIGYAFLIVKKKMGIKFLILADILTENQNQIEFIINTCKKYSSKSLFAFLTMFKLEILTKKIEFSINIKNRFNFLVKGKTEIETENLSTTDFNFFIGDLDFFW